MNHGRLSLCPREKQLPVYLVSFLKIAMRRFGKLSMQVVLQSKNQPIKSGDGAQRLSEIRMAIAGISAE